MLDVVGYWVRQKKKSAATFFGPLLFITTFTLKMNSYRTKCTGGLTPSDLLDNSSSRGHSAVPSPGVNIPSVRFYRAQDSVFHCSPIRILFCQLVFSHLRRRNKTRKNNPVHTNTYTSRSSSPSAIASKHDTLPLTNSRTCLLLVIVYY